MFAPYAVALLITDVFFFVLSLATVYFYSSALVQLTARKPMFCFKTKQNVNGNPYVGTICLLSMD
jgi:hypothetical protein